MAKEKKQTSPECLSTCLANLSFCICLNLYAFCYRAWLRPGFCFTTGWQLQRCGSSKLRSLFQSSFNILPISLSHPESLWAWSKGWGYGDRICCFMSFMLLCKLCFTTCYTVMILTVSIRKPVFLSIQLRTREGFRSGQSWILGKDVTGWGRDDLGQLESASNYVLICFVGVTVRTCSSVARMLLRQRDDLPHSSPTSWGPGQLIRLNTCPSCAMNSICTKSPNRN